MVSVVPDKYASKRQPIYDEQERIALLKALKCVDDALLCDAPGPEILIDYIRPSVYVRGAEYKGKQMPESAMLKTFGIEVRYTDPSSFHTSNIITKIKAS